MLSAWKAGTEKRAERGGGGGSIYIILRATYNFRSASVCPSGNKLQAYKKQRVAVSSTANHTTSCDIMRHHTTRYNLKHKLKTSTNRWTRFIQNTSAPARAMSSHPTPDAVHRYIQPKIPTYNSAAASEMNHVARAGGPGRPALRRQCPNAPSYVKARACKHTCKVASVRCCV